MRIILLIFYLTRLSFIDAQKMVDIKGEVVFPLINLYSAYGLDTKTATNSVKAYENRYKKAKKKNDFDREMRLFALVKERKLLYNPYLIVRDSMDRELIVYMDSAIYQKTFVWNYNFEELTSKQSYLWFQAKSIPLGENAYWLTEFAGITLIQDTTRSRATSKFAMDVYRK